MHVSLLHGWLQPLQLELLSGVHLPPQQYASLPHSESAQHVWQVPLQFFRPDGQHTEGPSPVVGGVQVAPPVHPVPPVPQVQVPDEQFEPAGQALPHVPQLALSFNIESAPGQVQYDEP